MPSIGPMIYIDTARAKQPILSQMQTPTMTPTDPSHVVAPNDTHPYGQEPISSSFTFPNLGDYPLGDTTTFMPNLVMSTANSALVIIVTD